MAQAGFTPILLYASGTPGNTPTAGNLTSSASGAELAVNYADGKLFYKDSGGSVQTLATKATGSIGGTDTQVQYNSSGSLAGSANLTFNGTTLTANALSLTTALSVPNGGTGLTGGTSGGVPYFSAANTLASSAALAANALVVGGGAGLAPSTITTGTGVTTALGVNTGSAGAFVVNGGALGTPSSGTVTNLTGTASININGTVGATTPNTGAFTSVVSTNAAGILTRAAATQDGVELIGRAGGTSSFKVTFTPTTLSASRTLTLPDNSGTLLTTGVAVTVPQGGTGLTSGTSGGLPYFNATNTMASSGLLAASALMVGGGAGASPSTITTGTGVTTALGVNTGTAGAFVVNGGALGTPSSGTVTNLTGTASININGTVGATTPNTGAFTSVVSTSASGVLNRAAATQDGIALVGRAGGTSSWSVSLTPTTLSASRTATFPDSNTTIPIATQQLTFSGPTAARTITFPDANITVARTDAANTFSGTQTFGGAVVPATNTVDSVGYTGTPVNSQSAAYTLVAADAGKSIVHPITDNNARTFTIPANGTVAFPVGTTITFINMINTVTIAITTDTLYLAGTGSTGARTLAAYGMATAVKVTSTSWIISGNGLS